MSTVDARTKFRGTLAVAALLTGLAAAKGVAHAVPAAPQPVAATGSSDQATGSAQSGVGSLISILEAILGLGYPTGHGSGVQ
ncbi:hypothetical protein GPX89_32375 [Nocardia sp. ET3-3]|uniref:Secreted protein n=1 Tax=Nocardia terrae TaxID=2675851 RepID=A0A7K1V609_9NOCA|nr:hypothetical protein [Nocardia terrae]MVU81922.1 hypothetical protein [Nocardia terrae]